MSNNRAFVDDNGRQALRSDQPEHPPIVEWEDDTEEEPEFSTYFADNKVEIPTFPDDDDKVIFCGHS